MYGANGLAVTTPANIPFVGTPVSTQEFLAPNSYPFLGGSAAAFPAMAKYALGQGIKKASILYADVGAGKLAADALLSDPLKAGGVEVTTVPEKIGAADFTPALVQANQGDPDVIFLLFSAEDCNRIFKAAGQIGVKARLAASGSCLEKQVIDGVNPAIVKGLFANSETLFYVKNDKQAELYRKALKKYADNASPSGFSAASFSQVMTLAGIGDTLGADLSAQSLLDTLKTASGIKVFMGTELDSAAPAKLAGAATHVFNTDQRIVTLKNGKVVEANENQWISGFK